MFSIHVELDVGRVLSDLDWLIVFQLWLLVLEKDTVLTGVVIQAAHDLFSSVPDFLVFLLKELHLVQARL